MRARQYGFGRRPGVFYQGNTGSIANNGAMGIEEEKPDYCVLSNRALSVSVCAEGLTPSASCRHLRQRS